MNCPKCQRKAPEGALVCEHDGTPLVSAGPPAEGSTASTNELLPPGSTVGEYKILEMLGEGGFGAVYRAEHPVIGKSAAIKVVKREYSANPEMTSRFVAEARAVNQIRHRNIIDIFNFGTLEDGRQYYVMELLDGSTLDALVTERGRLSFAEAQPIFRQLARALAAAHGAGIAHRDLKPENVFVAFDEDGNPVPKLLDFGLAKLLSGTMNLHRTRSGVPMGTPLYMSPEQVYGKDVDHRTDIYAFGIMVFQTLTGELPFMGESVMELMVKQTSAPRPAASEVCPDVPSELDEPIRRMMAKDPADRPESIVAAVDALFEAAQQAGIATSGSGMARLPEPSRRSEAGLSGSGTVAARSSGGSSSGAGRAKASSGAGRSSPSSSTAGLATEDTMMDPNVRLKQPDGAGRGRTVAFVAVAAGLVGAAFFGQRWIASQPVGAVPSASPAAARPETAEPTAEPTASAAGAPTVAPTPSVAPVKTAIVVKTKLAPKDAEVWVDGKKSRLEDGALELPVGDKPLKVEIRRQGYVPQAKEITPSKDQELEVTLVPAPRAREVVF